MGFQRRAWRKMGPEDRKSLNLKRPHLNKEHLHQTLTWIRNQTYDIFQCSFFCFLSINTPLYQPPQNTQLSPWSWPFLLTLFLLSYFPPNSAREEKVKSSSQESNNPALPQLTRNLTFLLVCMISMNQPYFGKHSYYLQALNWEFALFFKSR